MALGNVAIDQGAVSEREGDASLRRESDGAPISLRQQAVLRSAVHHEPDHAGSGWTGDDPLDVGESHTTIIVESAPCVVSPLRDSIEARKDYASSTSALIATVPSGVTAQSSQRPLPAGRPRSSNDAVSKSGARAWVE